MDNQLEPNVDTHHLPQYVRGNQDFTNASNHTKDFEPFKV